MRTLLVELRPNALVDVPLPVLLKQLCESFIGRARLPVQLNVDGKRTLPPDVQLAFYRITQEALNNIVKHAKATQVIVTLRLDDDGPPVDCRQWRGLRSGQCAAPIIWAPRSCANGPKPSARSIRCTASRVKAHRFR